MKKNIASASKNPPKTSDHTESAPAGSPGKGAGLMLKSILVPIDFSEPSKKAVDYAREMALRFGAALTLLYVIEPIPYPNDFGLSYPLVADNEALLKAVRENLDELCKAPGQPQIQTGLIRHGNPAHEICGAARELGMDLIVIATHGYSGLKHVLLGSTAEKVVRYAPCPVLTLRGFGT